jgi:hypothetical protein
MSDPESRTSQVPRISFKDAVRFFDEVVPNYACPACENDAFLIHIDAPSEDVDAAQGITSIRRSASTNQFKNIVTTVITLECSKCGLLQNHSALAIRRWLDKQKAEETPREDGE